MRSPLRFRNPFAFPGGVRPGVDWTHPAISASGQATLQSWIPNGKTLNNLVNGAIASTTGTVNAASTIIGPATVYSTTAGNYNTYTPAVVSWPTGTFGAIFSINTSSSAFFIRTFNGSASLSLMSSSLGPAFSVSGVTAAFTNIPNFVIGVPYFFGMTVKTGREYAVVVNLLTGQMWSDTKTQSFGAITSGQFLFGATGGCNIAAVMGCLGYVNLQPLLAWAESPWDFWYPPTLTNRILSTGHVGPSGPNTATVAVTEARDVVSVNMGFGANLLTLGVTEARDTVQVSLTNASTITATLGVTEALDVVRIAPGILGPPGVQFGSARRPSTRSPYAYPGASAIAAIDRQHVAYTSGLRQSTIALGNASMVNLLNGKKLPIAGAGGDAGAPGTQMTPFGPAYDLVTNWCGLEVPPVIPNEKFLSFTGAAILYFKTTTTNGQHVVGTSSANTSQDHSILLTSTPAFIFSSAGVATFSFPAVVGHTYFIAMSAGVTATPRRTAVVLDMTTGQLSTATSASNIGGSVVSGANYCVGCTHLYTGSHVGGNILASMMAHQYTSLADLVAWAERPWDFWYPPTVENTLFTSIRRGSGATPVNLTGDIRITPVYAGFSAPGSLYGRGSYGFGKYSQYTPPGTVHVTGDLAPSIVMRGVLNTSHASGSDIAPIVTFSATATTGQLWQPVEPPPDVWIEVELPDG